MGFLDYIGLTQYTDKFEKFITDKLTKLLDAKQDALTAGDGVSLASNVISVSEPVRGITKVEYDALSEAEQNTGLYIITDSVLNDMTTDSTSQGDIYSTEETRIGTWIDGKPLYRKSAMGGTLTVKAQWVKLFDATTWDIDYVPYFYGSYLQSTDQAIKSMSMFDIRYYTDKYVYIATPEAYITKWVMTIEYTKTTDTALASQTTLLTSEVPLPQTMILNSSTDVSASPLTVTFPNAIVVASASASSATTHFPYSIVSASDPSAKLDAEIS